jgi:hypothetical protein
LFAKLKLRFPLQDLPEDILQDRPVIAKSKHLLNLEDSYEKELFDKAEREGLVEILYFNFLGQNLLNLLPRELSQKERPSIFWQVLKGQTYVVPHKDSDRNTAINFYMKANDEKTLFYDDSGKSYYIKRLDNYISFPDWLNDPVCSFTAKTGDAYLLNVSCFHSVTDMKEGALRAMITIGFQTRYEDVLQILNNYELIDQA